MSKIKNILQAYTNPLPRDEKWFQDRLEKCLECEFNTANIEDKTLIDRLATKTIGPLGSCSLCKCPVDRKCSVKEEECALKPYKGLIPKWSAIENKSKLDGDLTIENLTEDVVSIVSTPDTNLVVKIEEIKPQVVFKLRISCKHMLEVRSAEPSCSCTTVTYTKIDNNTGEIGVVLSTTGFKKGMNKRYININYYKTPTKNKTLTIEMQTELK